MPKRSDPKSDTHTYSYEELLAKMQTLINEEYGGVAKFVETEKFLLLGFNDTKQDRSKFHTYLANQSDKTKIVKSFPILKKLYKILLNIELEGRIEVVRKQIIISNKSI